MSACDYIDSEKHFTVFSVFDSWDKKRFGKDLPEKECYEQQRYQCYVLKVVYLYMLVSSLSVH